MNKLCVYLPPFAPDYSGACSALFDLNALIVIHDASGCTGNYTGFDEPRWYGSSVALYCSGLREMDVIMGNEAQLIKRITAAAAKLSPELIAIVGSPVPMVMGTDFEGLASEIAAETGLPAFGFATTGTRYYNEGIFSVAKALIDRYCTHSIPVMRRTVNILGATPLDMSIGELEAMKRFLKNNGYIINACFAMDSSIETIRRIAGAAVNIAVTESGCQIAAYCEKRFATPWIAGRPLGIKGSKRFLERLEAAEVKKTTECRFKTQEEGQILIIGDSVAAQAIADGLECDFKLGCCLTASLFGERGFVLRDEDEIIREVNKENYSTIIADPLICDLLKDKQAKKTIEIPHFAISSKLFEPLAEGLIEERFNDFFKERNI